MSTVNLTRKEVKAKKDYFNDAYHCFDWMLTIDANGKEIPHPVDVESLKMAPGDVAEIQKAIDCKWRIMPGEIHQYQSGIYENRFYTNRISSALYEIICKYDLFPEE